MQGIQSQKVGSLTSLKNSNWEVILTDPSLNKFNFAEHITDQYITTDIISPFGEKSILYNTVSKQKDSRVLISLNFQDIDQTKISSISFKASEKFFECWRVLLRDNRSNNEVELNKETVLSITPVIELNKFANMGFLEGSIADGKSFFDVHLIRKTD